MLSCVCIQTLRVDHYGQGKGYRNRALLLYDGIHYDPLAVQLGEGADAAAARAMDITLFACDDDTVSTSVVAAAEGLAKAAQAKRQFTDTGSFELRCLVCQCGLKGQEEAVAHATATGHQNFSQY